MNRRVHRIGTNRTFKELMDTSSVKSWSHSISTVIVGGGGGGGVWLWNRREMMGMVVDPILVC